MKATAYVTFEFSENPRVPANEPMDLMKASLLLESLDMLYDRPGGYDKTYGEIVYQEPGKDEIRYSFRYDIGTERERSLPEHIREHTLSRAAWMRAAELEEKEQELQDVLDFADKLQELIVDQLRAERAARV